MTELNEVCRQEYTGNNCVISAGLVRNNEPACDTLYFRMEKAGTVDVEIYLRPDEAAALIWVLSGALWSGEMERMGKEEK